MKAVEHYAPLLEHEQAVWEAKYGVEENWDDEDAEE